MGPIKKNLKEKPLITLTELDFGNSVESFVKVLDSQKDLLHSQLDQLQNIIVNQCRLTGVNPLSQEMAAGALSINIGKKPRDLLNPKGVKYMQAVFSIKDTISKKETREISALCGLTASQVREFFSGQRSRVRKLVRLSREKAIQCDAERKAIECDAERKAIECDAERKAIECDAGMKAIDCDSGMKAIECDAERMSQGECPTSADPAMHIHNPAPLNTVDPNGINTNAGSTSLGGCSTCSDSAMPVINPIPLNSVDPKAVGDAPSCSSKEEMIPGADDYEKTFIENIFNLMKKEETFSGQVKLMEWILRIENSSVLYWFVTKGGLMMLAAWLNEAALEEQTTVLLVIFQVLCHLPLHKALPVQMSAVLQTVNRLRFYRTSDISNRAKALLSRWSKLFFKNQALKKPLSSTSSTEKGKSLGQSGGLSSEWHSNLDLPEELLSLALDNLEECRKSEPSPTLKLLQASSDDSNKKHILNASSTQTKERRKVQLMDQPGRNTNGRSLQVPRAVNANQARPMSADDIQKAKLRQTFMQSKYGKTSPITNGNRQQKIEDLGKSSSSQISPLQSPLKPHVRQIVEDSEKPAILSSLTSPTLPERPLEPMPSLGPRESPWEKLKKDQIPWHLPPEIKIPSEWSVCVGENSKEVEIQAGRIRREKETIYQRMQDIPPNPKEPWDREMDHDDSLTPQIPIEQAPEEFPAIEASQELPTTVAPEASVTEATAVVVTEVPKVGLMETQLPPHNMETETVLPPQNMETASVTCADVPAAPTPPTITGSGGASEPDLELLAVLLQNPDLVFALTSGQGGNLSSAETVRLLDMIKNSGGGLAGVVNGLNRNMEEKPTSFPSPTPTSFPSPTPTSFPSPTPTSESLMNGWSTEVGNNAHPQPVSVNNAYPQPVSVSNNSYPQPVSVINQEAHVPSPVRGSANNMVQHQSPTASFTPGLPQYLTQTTNFMPQQQNPEIVINSSENFHLGLNHHSIPIASPLERQLSDMNQKYNQMHPTYDPVQQNFQAASHQLQPEPSNFGQIAQQPEIPNYEHVYTGNHASVPVGMNLPDRTPSTLPPLMPAQQPAHFAENTYLQSMHPPTLQWNAASYDIYNQTNDYMDGRQRRYDAPVSNPWSHISHTNYNSYPEEPVHASVSERSSWDRNDYVEEPDLDLYSPGRRSVERSRSPEYRSRRNYSERRRDHGRNSRDDWSRRRDYGRPDHKQSNRRWRDRRS